MKVLGRVWRIAKPFRWLVVVAALLLAIATQLEVVAFPVLVGGTFVALDQPAAAGEVGPPGQANKILGSLQRRLNRIPAYATLEDTLHRDLKSDAGRFKWLVIFTVLGVGVFGLKGLCSWGYLYLNQYISQHVMKTLRGMLYEKLLQLPLSFYESRKTGELMSRMTNDIALVQNLVSVQLADALVAVITVTTGMAAVTVISWQLTALALVVVPILSVAIGKAGGKMRIISRRMQQRLADMNAQLQERIGSINIIQSFAREQYENDQFDSVNQRTVDVTLQAARVSAPLQPMVEFIGVFGMMLGIAFAGWYIISNKMTIPNLMMYFIIMQQVGMQFSKLGRINLALQQGISAGSRVLEVLDRESEVQDRPDAKELPPIEGRVVFHKVSFRYAEGGEVLRDMDLVVEPGEVVALVGPSGAGKTSITKLIPRFYDPTEGWIEIDGHDIRTVTLHSLRRQIGLVPQETVLFTGSIRENIAYGRLDASQAEIEQAAMAANAHDFILGLEKGYDTEVGERGVKLSGGQRQRIAIARTLLKDPHLLILDEATSSLDTESESAVQEALERLMAGRTTVVIAHRLSTVRNANRIMVLQGGRIVEIGTHSQLMRANGLYRRLYQMQFRDDSTPAEESE